MKRETLTAASLVQATALVLCLASFAQADSPVPHKERATGQITNIVPPDGENPGHMDFVAGGFATHMGGYSEVGGHDFYPDGTLFGEFEITASNGATTSGIYYGTFEAIGGGMARFDVTVEWLEGTGRLDDVTGSGNAIAILDLSTGMFNLVADATWQLH